MTLKEFKKKLSQYPDDLEVIIEDADTGWYLRLSEINLEKEYRYLILCASYRDEVRG
jgi:hypothetical protein